MLGTFQRFSIDTNYQAPSGPSDKLLSGTAPIPTESILPVNTIKFWHEVCLLIMLVVAVELKNLNTISSTTMTLSTIWVWVQAVL